MPRADFLGAWKRPRCPQLCRFLDAGNDETLLALGRPASKKRQGTKSREVGYRLSSGRYGDLTLAPAVKVGTMRPGWVCAREPGRAQWASQTGLTPAGGWQANPAKYDTFTLFAPWRDVRCCDRSLLFSANHLSTSN